MGIAVELIRACRQKAEQMTKRELASDVATAPRFADCIASLGIHLVGIICHPYENLSKVARLSQPSHLPETLRISHPFMFRRWREAEHPLRPQMLSLTPIIPSHAP